MYKVGDIRNGYEVLPQNKRKTILLLSDDLRMTSELYTMYACFLDYGISPEILLDISSFLMPITTAFVVMKAVMTISSYNGVIKEKFSDKIKLKEQELAEARKIKMISGERALDNLHKLYDK